ncbi:hypothetical protein EZE46_28340 [Bacillus sp. BH2]|uniref:SA1002 family membrane protein n=1 Tax=Bacillus sp. BH2 TaxID=2528958 RepID=UPI001067059B|nr:hypothetical protein [Bacillus sp. BH2]TEA45649.1 hypothetical protein EZE46_28340 [Bacillus sp. BH2]
MHILIYIIIITILLFLISKLTYKKISWYKIKTAVISLFFLVCLFTFSNLLIVVISFIWVSTFLLRNELNILEGISVDSVLYLSVINILLIAIVLFYFINLAGRFIKLSIEILEIAEYLIQWITIYLTLYQLCFGTFINQVEFLKGVFSNFENPDFNVFAYLISLLSIWIAVVMHKIRISNANK